MCVTSLAMTAFFWPGSGFIQIFTSALGLRFPSSMPPSPSPLPIHHVVPSSLSSNSQQLELINQNNLWMKKEKKKTKKKVSRKKTHTLFLHDMSAAGMSKAPIGKKKFFFSHEWMTFHSLELLYTFTNNDSILVLKRLADAGERACSLVPLSALLPIRSETCKLPNRNNSQYMYVCDCSISHYVADSQCRFCQNRFPIRFLLVCVSSLLYMKMFERDAFKRSQHIDWGRHYSFHRGSIHIAAQKTKQVWNSKNR